MRDRYFRSASFPLILFLYSKGAVITGINPTDDPKKKEFALVKTVRLKELADKYKWGDKNDPDLLVPVHLYEQARRELLDRLNER